MNLSPGEVWLADLGLAAKTRPVVIVSREDRDAPRALAIYVPLTTQNRNSPYGVAIPQLAFLDEISVANVQGIASIPTIRLERKLGTLPGLTKSILHDGERFVSLSIRVSRRPGHRSSRSICGFLSRAGIALQGL